MHSTCLLDLKDTHKVFWWETRYLNITRLFTRKFHWEPLRVAQTFWCVAICIWESELTGPSLTKSSPDWCSSKCSASSSSKCFATCVHVYNNKLYQIPSFTNKKKAQSHSQTHWASKHDRNTVFLVWWWGWLSPLTCFIVQWNTSETTLTAQTLVQKISDSKNILQLLDLFPES